MGDSNKQICRLCLEITPAYENQIIEDMKNEMEVLQITIDFNISDYAVACTRCLNMLQYCFDFKSQCTTTLMANDYKVVIKEKDVFPRQMMSKEDINMEIPQSCRLCKSLIENKSDWKDEELLKDMIRNCLPQMDMDPLHEPPICSPCITSIKIYYEFMKACQEVEQRIGKYCDVVRHGGSADRITLEDMLKFEESHELDKPITVKRERSDVENDEMSEIKCYETDGIESIKCEVIDIKDELDDESNSMNEVTPTLYCGCSADKKNCLKCPAKSTFDIKNAMPCYSDDMPHKCCQCPFVTKSMHKCEVCEFETEYKFILAQHMISHSDPKAERKFKCEKCPYETDYKKYLRKHNLTHMDKSEVNMHKCETCNYETKHKSDLIRHMMRHRDPNARRKFKCDQCPYETDFKFSLRAHDLIHKDKSEVEMYKCKACSYETKHKASLVRHNMTHRALKFERQFKCDKCTYETDIESSLKIHNLIHMDKSEVEMYKCESCKYETRHKTNMTQHMLTRKHRKSQGERKLKCGICPYESDIESDLRAHNVIHKDKSEMEMHKCLIRNDKSEMVERRVHKCEKCDYETEDEGFLTEHMRTHEFSCSKCPYRCERLDVEKHMMVHYAHNPYRCDVCTYSTNTSTDLDNHKQVHQDNEMLDPLQRCDQCTFQTKCREKLAVHMSKHDPSKQFKCDQCEYTAKFKCNLRRHLSAKHLKQVYNCDLCDYKSNKFGISNHMRSCLKRRKLTIVTDDKKGSGNRKSLDGTDGLMCVGNRGTTNC